MQSTGRRWSERRRQLQAQAQKLRGYTSSPIIRRVWQALTIVSLVAALLSIVYLWEQLRPDGVQFQPRYLFVAAAIYAVAYVQQLLGWQATTRYFFGRLPFRENAQAVATSTLLKFLPTIAWYIANRIHFYDQRNIPRRAVLAAALFELVAMTASGAILYSIYWAVRHPSFVTYAGMSLLLVGSGMLCRPGGVVRRWWRERIRANIVASSHEAPQKWGLIGAFVWYGSSWVVSIAFFWTLCSVFMPLSVQDLEHLLNAWLLANLANNLLNFTLGAVPIARELTLSVLLAQFWPWPIALAAVALVKIFFTLGDILCSALVLACLYVIPRKSDA